MMSVPASILEKIPHLPESPGVYLWRDAQGKVLYVGKAKRLRSRVRSYVATDHAESVKTRALMQQAAALDTIVVPSEAHALILEANLIKEYKPRFNIALRDDKSYPYIKVTVQEPFPRVWVTRRLQNDGARYFGPYTDVGAMRRSLDVVKRLFTVRSCNFDMPKQMPDRPCLDYHIGRCKAPCILAQTQAEYAAMIDEVIDFLNGKPEEVERKIRERMELAAESLDFERAAQLRDVLSHLEKMEEPTVVMKAEGGDSDVVGYARDGDDAVAVLLRVRDGKVLGREHRFLENVEGEEDAAILNAFLVRYYLPADARALRVVLPFPPAELNLLAELEPGTDWALPQRGIMHRWMLLAEQNARHLLESLRIESFETEERAEDPVYALGRDLGLQRVPRSLVCVDISHNAGRDTVGSLVWFEGGRPRKSEYRKFRIGGLGQQDDFAAIHEVITRYLTRRRDESLPLPDLIVIDGGKGQLGAAIEAARALDMGEVTFVSLAKKEEEVFIPGRPESLRLPRRSPSLRLLQRARDEAHRFGVAYSRKRRSERTITSELLNIKGIGAKRRRLLLERFGSLAGVKSATVSELASVEGVSTRLAERILEHLQGR